MIPDNEVYIDGGAPVTGDGLNTFVQTCDTFATLRGFIGLDGMQVFLRGAITPGDGAGGAFYFDSASTAPDNNINVIVPTGATGAWLATTGSHWAITGGDFSWTDTGVIVGRLGMIGFRVGRGGDAIADSAAGPFVYLSTMQGTPIGVPTGGALGQTPVVWDSTGKKLWAYDFDTTTWLDAAGSHWNITSGEFRWSDTGITVGRLGTSGFRVGAGSLNLPDSAIGPFVYVSTIQGTPIGVPALGATGQTAVVWDSTAKKLWAYDFDTTTWLGVVLAP